MICRRIRKAGNSIGELGVDHGSIDFTLFVNSAGFAVATLQILYSIVEEGHPVDWYLLMGI